MNLFYRDYITGQSRQRINSNQRMPTARHSIFVVHSLTPFHGVGHTTSSCKYCTRSSQVSSRGTRVLAKAIRSSRRYTSHRLALRLSPAQREQFFELIDDEQQMSGGSVSQNSASGQMQTAWIMGKIVHQRRSGRHRFRVAGQAGGQGFKRMNSRGDDVNQPARAAVGRKRAISQ